jgi:hypothetical protein
MIKRMLNAVTEAVSEAGFAKEAGNTTVDY